MLSKETNNRNANHYKKPVANNEEFYKTKLRDLEKSFVTRLHLIENIHRQQIETERNVILNSWRWRIGDFQVGIILAIKDFFVRLFRVINGKKYLYNSSGQGNVIIKQNRQAKSTDHHHNLPELNHPVLACVFDTFTHSCFKPEFNILSPYPENWKRIADPGKVDALFCESAWNGANSSWRFYIGKLGNQKKQGLNQMVEGFKKKGIPTIFWNKEDPVHFDHFIEDAKIFDYIFTSDAEIISKYEEHTHHKNIYPLAFAAQEALHNPVREKPRDRNVCFAGTWYNTKYAERILDMRMILPPAIDYGLEIYDRNYGASGYEKVMYDFPDIYKPFIKGKLEYHEMVNTYKRYKVFLNINSVRYSPTMLARRVFELLACGTPVISTYSAGIINLLGEDSVMFAETEDETRRHLENILSEESLWWSYSLRGIRNVMENHTYNHRTKEIFDVIGLPFETKKLPKLLVLAKVSQAEDVDYLIHLLKNQAYKNFEVLVFCHSEINYNAEAISQKIKRTEFDFRVQVAENHGTIQQLIKDNDRCGYVAIFSQSAYYGKNYLRDFAIATRYAPKVQIFGKGSTLDYTSSSKIRIINKGMEFQNASSLFSSSVVLSKQSIIKIDIMKLFEKEVFSSNSTELLSIDPYNLLLNGRFADPAARSLSEL
jgi:glycosyltransferase involved in cell wall biosynthesis